MALPLTRHKIISFKIQCRVQVVDASMDPRVCQVKLYVKDMSSRIKVDGVAISTQNFTIKDAEVISVYPNLGPRSGGTNMTIFGRNLEAGSNISVYIGNISRCFIISVSKDGINCTTERLFLFPDDVDDSANVSTTFSPPCGEIIVVINKATLKSTDLFCYFKDPDISSITPKRTIESGGLLINVTGSNLNTIARPRIGISVNGSSESSKLGDCHVHQGGRVMICQSPETGRVLDGGNKVSGHIWFEMDGVDEMRNFSQYYPSLSTFSVYPDPDLLPFNGSELPTIKPNTRLEIQGSGMKGVISESDIIILIGPNTCRLIVVHMTRVVCTPQFPAQTVSLPVRVKIGNLEFKIGVITLSGVGQQTPPPAAGTTLPVSTDLLIGLCVGGAVFVTIVTVALIMAAIKCRSVKEHKPLSEYSSSDGYQLSPTQVIQRTLDSFTLEKINSCNILIPRDLLTIGDVIGSGNFGCVHEGYLKGDNNESVSRKVAVKNLQESSTQMVDFKAFVEEALLMKDFNHPHVLCLVGITLTDDRQPLVVLPYMENGDLLKYVSSDTQVVTVRDVIRFGQDIAAGMFYLANLKFVHRDLAARNCMLDECFRVKVADFGLCRDIYEKGYYSSDNKKKLPIRWMAMESIDKGTYSSKSDVWSLGIVLWELLTRGITPYPGVDGWDIIRFLQLGKRLFRPWFCSENLYQLLLQCWSKDPSDRPTFHMISEYLEKILKDLDTMSESETEITMSECCQYRESVLSCHEYLVPEGSMSHSYHTQNDPLTDPQQDGSTTNHRYHALNNRGQEDPTNHSYRTLNDREPGGPTNHSYRTLNDREPGGPTNHSYRTLNDREPGGPMRHSYHTLNDRVVGIQQELIPQVKNSHDDDNSLNVSKERHFLEPATPTKTARERDGSCEPLREFDIKDSASKNQYFELEKGLHGLSHPGMDLNVSCVDSIVHDTTNDP
ncbi:macrophage-stimulating protein receptor-like [Gigantopelta aegis]|uniref:macrophage-stimulating protein receptor-like n=1 Tax=Gigantopelta aegis TaxID=1735272 RepID=UPI001B889C34|nr:macrophage-stimulating protein receptor-like [Gigantopelta aegis]